MSIFETNPTRRNGDRSVHLNWELGPTTDFHGNPATATARLSVYDNRNRKELTASVSRIDTKTESGMAVEMYQPMSGTRVRLASMACPRYSAKALETAVVCALTELRSRLDEPAVQAVGDPTSPA
jgi:hypothetical protein